MPTTNLRNDLNLIHGNYFRDGLPATFANTVIVRSASALASIDSSKVYMIDGTVDMGSASIVVPPGGISIAGLNGARDVAVLTSSVPGHQMFTTALGSYSGNVVLESMTVSDTGAGSAVFALDNDGNQSAIDMANVNFTDCASLGEVTAYRQLFFTSCGMVDCDDGLTMSGAWAGLAATNSIAVGFPAATLFKAGTGLTFSGSIRSNMNFIAVDPAAVFMDFAEANITPDEGLLLDGFRTTATDAMPNLPGSSVKVRYTNCRGILNTYIGGRWVVTTPAATVIGASNTKYKVAGTVTYSDLEWFDDGGGNNSLRFISEQGVQVEAQCVMTASGSNADQINVWLRMWDDSASAYVDVASSGLATLNAAGRAEGVTLFGYAAMDENDRIELWVENTSAANNITVLAGGLFGVSER